MNIYYFLGIISFGIFLIQFTISMFFGDLDIDIDGDGEVDMDANDIVSFKGLIHFIMGFSSWTSFKYMANGTISTIDFIIAIVIGLSFILILFYVYKLCTKLAYNPPRSKAESLVGQTVTVVLVFSEKSSDGLYYYNISGYTNGETITHAAVSTKEYNIGDKVKVLSYHNNFINI